MQFQRGDTVWLLFMKQIYSGSIDASLIYGDKLVYSITFYNRPPCGPRNMLVYHDVAHPTYGEALIALLNADR